MELKCSSGLDLHSFVISVNSLEEMQGIQTIGVKFCNNYKRNFRMWSNIIFVFRIQTNARLAQFRARELKRMPDETWWNWRNKSHALTSWLNWRNDVPNSFYHCFYRLRSATINVWYNQNIHCHPATFCWVFSGQSVVLAFGKTG